MLDISATIFDIYRGTTHDGPGLRDTVFFSGCPLSCGWCHNPEGLFLEHKVWHQPKTCIGCMSCVESCENNAIKNGENNFIVDSSLCIGCGNCVEECPTKSFTFIKKDYKLDFLVQELLRDKEYFKTSNGGVTASGGECLIHHNFVTALFQELHQNGIHTALDTCGLVSKEIFLNALKVTDCLLLDLKFIDSKLHKKFTGQDNSLILENALLAKEFAQKEPLEIWIRTPLIPSATAVEKNIKEIGDFIKNDLENAVTRWELCSFNNVCASKYERLNLSWEYRNATLLKKSEAEHLLEIAKSTNAAKGEIYLTGLIAED